MTDMTPAGGPGGHAPGAPAVGDAGGAGGAGDLAEDAGVAAERERLARQLREVRMQLVMTETRLAALEQSSTMKFGRTIANAAKKPWPKGALLPRELYRIWKDRGAPKSGAKNAATALAAAQLADLSGTGGRFLSSLTAPGVLALADPALALAGGLTGGAAGTGTGLVITGAISALGCATLAPDAVVHPLLPHDADVLIEGTGADLVLIEAAALLPGAPWAYATDPAAADRGRRLARLIVMARSLGKPVVLVRNVPVSLMPGLGWLAAACDAVVDGGLGVQLARFNPIGVTVARATSPVYAGARDPREGPAVRALLDSLTVGVNGADAPVRVTGARSWRSLPALYRDHSLFVTASADQAREQIASGARVIGPIGSGTDAGTVRGQLEATRGGRPAALAEVRVWLRDIFAEHATPARLAGILRAADLPGDLVRGRQIAVLASVSDAAEAGRLASALLDQRLRPAEVIAATRPTATAAVREALAKLTDHDIRVVVTSVDAAPPDSARGLDWTRPLARLASVPWLAPWTADAADADAAAGRPAWYLLDLACARECAQADAVGFGSGEYEFTHWLERPALVKAALLAPEGPAAADWGSHGLRLFTITA